MLDLQSSRSRLGLPERTRGFGMRYAFYHVYLAFSLGAATVILIPVDGLGGRGSNAIFSAAWIAMHALAMVFLLSMPRVDSTNLVIAAGIGLFIIASTLWSASPRDSLVYGSMLAGNILVAYMLAIDLTLSQIIKLTARVVLVLALLGILAVAVGYDQAFYFDAHNRPNLLGSAPIRGFFNHKVPGALFATLGAVACLHAFRGARRVLSVAVLGLFVAMTGSSTGLVLYPTAMVIYWILTRARRRGTHGSVLLVIAAVLIAPIAVLLIEHWEGLLEALGRDSSLTGRTYLWQWGLQTWYARPILGWGFNGYLNGPDGGNINSVVRQLENYDVPHFHQSFIQTGVDLGVVGILILVTVIASSIQKSYRRLVVGDSDEGVASLTLLIVMLVASMSMFIFLQYNQFATLLLFAIFFSTRRSSISATPNTSAVRSRYRRVSQVERADSAPYLKLPVVTLL